jgi:hypothetical protein
MKNQFDKASSLELDAILLPPWTEYVGKVVHISDGNITLETVQRTTIPISSEVLDNWKTVIQKGRNIGILALDDGTIRVRSVP